jgi:uncharacterized protein
MTMTTTKAVKRGLMSALLAWGVGAAAQTGAAACPPEPRPPTPEQIQAAQRTARDHGALWRVARDGRTSYLFGTIHVGKLDWALPGPRLLDALAATDTIALELDPTDPQLASRMSAVTRTDGPPLALSEALARRLALRIDAACLPAAARPLIEAQHPVMRVVTLSVLEARWEGLDVGYAQEFVLAGFGRAAGRPIVSLETPELQLAALMPGDAAQLQDMVASALEQIEKGSARRSIAHLGAAWERGDLADMEQYERWCECVPSDADRQQMQRMIQGRNPALAERIDALQRDGRRLLVAVGALHMVGPQGLPALLRARGFTVERVAFQ